MEHSQFRECNSNNLVHRLSLLAGEEHAHSEWVSVMPQQVSTQRFVGNLDMWKTRYETNPSLNNGVDYSAALLHNNRANTAIDVLLALNTQFPNTYQIATNLGTAYELMGDNHHALEWIEKGIALNPQSHSHSEWVHVKILKAKIQANGDPNWFQHHSILGLSFREHGLFVNALDFPKNNYGQRATLQEMIDHVGRQLHERMVLVPKKDPVVANLLFDLGHLLALEKAHEHGQDILKISQHYGDSKARQSRIVLQWHELVDNLPKGLFTLYMMGIWLLLWLGYILVCKVMFWWRARNTEHSKKTMGVSMVSSVVIAVATIVMVGVGLLTVQSVHPFLGLHMSVFEGTVLFPVFAVFVGVAVGLWRGIIGKRKPPSKTWAQ
jgi:tetratricopeptide (TPR) repeat protein